MSERVHFIPVGFDFERLVYPITKGEMEADRVVLISHEGESDDEPENKAAELAGNMADELSKTFGIIDVEVEWEYIDIDEIHNYERLFTLAYARILEELEKGNEVFVNISSMPRTTAFAFANAADSIIAEFQGEIERIRNHLHTYYVAPEKYLILEMIEVLEGVRDLFEEMGDDIRVHPQYTKVQNLLDSIEEKGVTEGAKSLNDQMYVDIPSAPSSDVEDFEGVILQFLQGRTISSTSSLAEQLAEEQDEEYDESYRSRVQYNVSNLDEKGYVRREKVGNRLETQLSTMGRMWVKTH